MFYPMILDIFGYGLLSEKYCCNDHCNDHCNKWTVNQKAFHRHSATLQRCNAITVPKINLLSAKVHHSKLTTVQYFKLIFINVSVNLSVNFSPHLKFFLLTVNKNVFMLSIANNLFVY